MNHCLTAALTEIETTFMRNVPPPVLNKHKSQATMLLRQAVTNIHKF